MRIIRLVTGLVVLGFILCGVANPTFAQEAVFCPICSKANDPSANYAEKAGHTLLRGTLNATLGWTEMILQPAKEAKAGGNVLVGVANGIGGSVTRTLSGLAEMFTFWTPKMQGTYLHFSKDCPLDTTR